MISKWIHDDDRNHAWNANTGKHPIRIGLSWFEASKLSNDAKLSVVQSHPILEKNWKRKFSSNSCIPHGKSYFRRQEINFSSESPNPRSLDQFDMRQDFWERNEEKKMNQSEIRIMGRYPNNLEKKDGRQNINSHRARLFLFDLMILGMPTLLQWKEIVD